MTVQQRNATPSKDLSPAKKALLERRLRGDLKRTAPADTIPARPGPEPVPLSDAQERFWFMSRLEPESPAYNMYEVVRLRGKLDRAALTQSFQALIRRHEILRTQFITGEGRPSQQILPDLDFDIAATELSPSSHPNPAAQAQEIILSEIRRPFDLARGPLLRALLLKQADDDHILVLTIHHIIFDEWSSELFWQELSALYRAFSQGQTPSLPELPVQYADFSLWHKERIRKHADTQLAYWQKQLDVEFSLLRLPTDRRRPARQTFRGAITWLPLPDELYTQVKALNQTYGTTTFMTLLAAFQLLLHRYTDQTDILVGTPIANRSHSQTKNLIGLFLNTLVMRANFADNPRFDEFLKRARQTALDGYANQDLPFEALVEALRPPRDASYNPIFQAMFVHQKSVFDEIDLPGLTVSEMPVDAGVSKFDLTLFVQESDRGLSAGLEYNTDLFDSTTADRILGHFKTLVTGIVANPQQRISEFQLLTAGEQHTLLHQWNDTRLNLLQPPQIQHFIEQHAAQTPDAVAVADNTGHLTYRQLDQRANQLAHYLQKRGVGPNRPVGLVLERSTEMMVAILGVLKAGGAYLPLDPAYPAERLAFMLSDTQAPVLLTQQKLAGSLPTSDAQTLLIDSDWETIAREEITAPPLAPNPENLAYVIYTSGSTGKPKGVPVTHQNLVHSTAARFAFYENKAERFLLLSSFTFDSSVVGIFWALCQGGTLVLPPSRIEQDMRQLAATVAAHKITHILTLPSLYAILLEQTNPAHLASLRTVIVAGEECRQGLVKRHYDRLPQAALYNEYGPTEGTVWSTACKIPATFAGNRVPIGRPIPNMQNFILDRHGQPAPIGVPGELCIGGVGVTRGYLNRPELTAEKFREHTFAGLSPIRLYHTGDLARYLPDGNIEFLGRLDHQVKIRGFRIEVGEIEAALSRHPAVRQAVVTVHTPAEQNNSANKRLVAYVEPVQGQQAAPGDLRRFLLDRLPDYMAPATFVLLDALPVTPNGKVDRKKLPAPDIEPAQTTDAEFAPPRTPLEEKLAVIWADVLGLKAVGIYDNFFELGGDSILSIQIIAKAARQKIKLKPNDIFRYPSVATLAGVAQWGGSTPETQPRAVTGPVQLTPIQHWFFEQNLSEPHHWNQAYLLELAPDVDLALVERALQQLLLHHDALRLRFARTDSGWMQENAGPEQSVRVARFNLADLPSAEQQAALEKTVQELQQSLDLTSGCLLQAAVFAPDAGQTLTITGLLGLTGYSIATLLGIWLIISIFRSGRL